MLGKPSDSALESMENGGMHIRGHETKPALVCCLPRAVTEIHLPQTPVNRVRRLEASASTWLEVVLTEGTDCLLLPLSDIDATLEVYI